MTDGDGPGGRDAGDRGDDADDGGRLSRFLRSKLRAAGETYAEARRAYEVGRTAGELPTDEEGRVRLVCRRHAERRAVAVDEAGRPACFEADHPDCEGCAEDVRSGVVETWAPDGE